MIRICAISLLFCLVTLYGCKETKISQEDKVISDNKPGDLISQQFVNNGFAICQEIKAANPSIENIKNKEDCIDRRQVFDAAFGKFKQKTTVGNLTIVTEPRMYVAQIIYASKFIDGEDSYAIFLIQSNPIDDERGLLDCHACAPYLGAVVYEYRNKWQVLSVNSTIDEFGSWGDVFSMGARSTAQPISIYKNGIESFILTFEGSDMGQGYKDDWMNIIAISGKNSLVGTPRIISLGSISTVKDSSGTCTEDEEDRDRENGLDWVSKQKLIFDMKNPYPRIKLTKFFTKKCKPQELLKLSPVEEEYVYSFSEKKYIQLK